MTVTGGAGARAGAGLRPARVAEVLVRPAGGAPGRRGSGYLVGDDCVLTAAHVVAGPLEHLRVRFDADRPGEWSAPARVLLLSTSADVALLHLPDLPDLPSGRAPVEPPAYAAVPDADVVLPFRAVGFPRFKLRADPAHPADDGSPSQYRDSCHLSGTVSVLSNRREGTLELAVAAPPEREDGEPGRSPWEGMSGAAVWWDGAVIGVISAHHRADGLGRLAAGRVERWYETLSPAELELFRRHAGLPPRPAGHAPADGPEAPSPAVSLARLTPDVPLRDLVDLVDALTALPVLRGAGGMTLLLDSISGRIAANAPRDPRLRTDVFGVVRTCLRYPGTLDQLLEAVRLLEGDSPERRRVDREAALLARRHG
ncbi:trypsin-like peptidase domain-containing protein [Streptomyces sp. NPDC004065]|uniref:effector-associated domain 2-containing protein n=1 Tax=Streptomyces sp. NPDC004065 TaxID=3364689 RepID=UPI0038507C69